MGFLDICPALYRNKPRTGPRHLAGVFLLCIFFSPALVSQSHPNTEVLTLEEAVILALQHNRPIQISLLEVEKLDENVSAFRTHRLPVLQVLAIGSSLLTPVDFEFRQGVFGTYPGVGPIPAQNTDITTPRRLTGYMSNSVMQPLTQLYKINLEVKSLELTRDIGREDLRAKRHDIRNQTTRVYYDMAQTQSALDASTKAVAFYAELDRVTDQFLLQQVVLKPESIDVKLRLAREQLQNVQLRNLLEDQQEKLNRLLGRDIRQRFRVAPTAAATLAELDLEFAQSQALEQRPELRQAHLKTKQAEYDRRHKKAEYIPDVSFAVQQLSFLNIEMLPTNVLSVGFALTWEPFDWGRKHHELAAKSKTVEQTQTELRETEAQVLQEVNAQFRRVQETAAAMHVSQLAMDAASEKLRVTSDQYRVQAVRLDHVLEAQAVASTAAFEYQKALSNYWTAKADLAKAMGED
jgi:outer membrane protein